MTTTGGRVLLPAILVLAAAGCGSSDDGGRTVTTSAAGRPAPRASTAPTPRQTAAGQPTPAERGGVVHARSARTRRQAAAYDSALSDLPYGAGPLPVAQTIVSEDQPGMLVARLSPQRFFCLGSPARRAAAVGAYYAAALQRARRKGLHALSLVVAPLGDTAQVTLVWARASGARVRLTAAGRSGRCRRR